MIRTNLALFFLLLFEFQWFLSSLDTQRSLFGRGTKSMGPHWKAFSLKESWMKMVQKCPLSWRNSSDWVEWCKFESKKLKPLQLSKSDGTDCSSRSWRSRVPFTVEKVQTQRALRYLQDVHAIDLSASWQVAFSLGHLGWVFERISFFLSILLVLVTRWCLWAYELLPWKWTTSFKICFAGDIHGLATTSPVLAPWHENWFN